jgi:hypothetical protein
MLFISKAFNSGFRCVARGDFVGLVLLALRYVNDAADDGRKQRSSSWHWRKTKFGTSRWRSLAGTGLPCHLSVREILVRQRTQLINSLRGSAREFGIIARRGTERVEDLLKQVAAADVMPQTAQTIVTRVDPTQFCPADTSPPGSA